MVGVQFSLNPFPLDGVSLLMNDMGGARKSESWDSKRAEDGADEKEPHSCSDSCYCTNKELDRV